MNEYFTIYIFPVLIICCFLVSCYGIIYFKKKLDKHDKISEKKYTCLKEGELSKSLIV